MLFTTPSQWAALALVLVAGWLFGLASHSGGRKWRERYAAERDAHAAYRREADARVATERETHLAAGKETDARLASANARIAELERENDRLARAAPVTAQTIAPRDQPIAPAPSAIPPRERVMVSPSASARPAYPTGEKRGWFDWGPRRYGSNRLQHAINHPGEGRGPASGR